MTIPLLWYCTKYFQDLHFNSSSEIFSDSSTVWFKRAQMSYSWEVPLTVLPHMKHTIPLTCLASDWGVTSQQLLMACSHLQSKKSQEAFSTRLLIHLTGSFTAMLPDPEALWNPHAIAGDEGIHPVDRTHCGYGTWLYSLSYCGQIKVRFGSSASSSLWYDMTAALLQPLHQNDSQFHHLLQGDNHSVTFQSRGHHPLIDWDSQIQMGKGLTLDSVTLFRI